MEFCFLGLVLAGEGLVYCLARRRCKGLFQELDGKDFPFKNSFLPMGYLLLCLLGIKFDTAYDNRLYNKLAELYDYRRGRFFLQVHWAQKAGYFLLVLLLGSILLAADGKTDFIMVAFIILAASSAFLAPDYQLNKRLAERQLRIRLDFPGFVNKLTLLINAGMTVNRAWEKAALSKGKDTPLYAEVNRVLLEIRGGKPAAQAYEDFARRCRTPEVTRFITLILQNLRTGNAEMVSILRAQAKESWEMRKHAAKRMGEEASTKLLLPLMLMFVAILLIAATPAILALRNI